MSYQEKNITASLVALIIVLAAFYSRVSTMYLGGRFDGPEGLILLGKTGLVLIGVSILAVIAATIVLSIVYATITGDAKPSEVVDERDRLIERRGAQISDIATGFGFIGAMVALVSGMAAVPVFFIIALSFFGGELIAGHAKLTTYRLSL